jgi:undecaprenyl-diphosphatase
MTDPTTARTVARFWPFVSAAVGLVLVVLLGILVTVRAVPHLVDEEWLEEVVEHRSPLWTAPSLVMNFLGGGWFAVIVVPVVGVIGLVVLRRYGGALYLALALGLSAGLVQLLKAMLGRARPDEAILTVDSGAFPSGHVTNAATLAAVLVIIWPRWWIIVAGAVYTVAMLLSRTYLGVHWLTDTFGGLVLGVAIAVMLWAPFAATLRMEPRPRRPIASSV